MDARRLEGSKASSLGQEWRAKSRKMANLRRGALPTGIYPRFHRKTSRRMPRRPRMPLTSLTRRSDHGAKYQTDWAMTSAAARSVGRGAGRLMRDVDALAVANLRWTRLRGSGRDAVVTGRFAGGWRETTGRGRVWVDVVRVGCQKLVARCLRTCLSLLCGACDFSTGPRIVTAHWLRLRGGRETAKSDPATRAYGSSRTGRRRPAIQCR